MTSKDLITHVPATPGFRWIRVGIETVEAAKETLAAWDRDKRENAALFFSDPIIAWRIRYSAEGDFDEPIPIVPSGMRTDFLPDEYRGVIHPDGQVDGLNSEWHESVRAFLQAAVVGAEKRKVYLAERDAKAGSE